MKQHSFKRVYPRAIQSRQRGVALVVGLIILLVMTMIGIIAVRSSTLQGRMAGSYQQQAGSFQFSESAIRLVMAQVNQLPGTNLPNAIRNQDLPSTVIQTNTFWTDTAATRPPNVPAVPANSVVNVVASTASAGGSGFDASANFYATGICGDGTSPCPMMVGSSINKYSAFSFEINSLGSQPRTAARSNNIQGVTMLAPKQGG